MAPNQLPWATTCKISRPEAGPSADMTLTGLHLRGGRLQTFLRKVLANCPKVSSLGEELRVLSLVKHFTPENIEQD